MGVVDRAGTGSNDDLVASMLDSLFDEQPLAGFLETLRQATGATYASLVFKPEGIQSANSIELFAGERSPEHMRSLYFEKLYAIDPLPYDRLVPGRAYSNSELLIAGQEAHDIFYRDFLIPCGMRTMRMMRITTPAGLDAWLILSSPDQPFGDDIKTRLEALAPFLQRTLRIAMDRERQRISGAASGHALQRLSFGWMTLDRQGRTLEADDFCTAFLETSRLIMRTRGGKLRLSEPRANDALQAAIANIAFDSDRRAHAIRVSEDPWTEVLLVPYASSELGAALPARMIAYVHSDTHSAGAREEQMVQLFNLLPSEARLALVLAKGVTISEAAQQLGLTVETARNYSKKIYSKVGARGQAELIWIMMSSILAISS